MSFAVSFSRVTLFTIEDIAEHVGLGEKYARNERGIMNSGENRCGIAFESETVR